MIKLIASDLDGTLLKEGTMDINPEIYDIIRKLKAKGIVFAAVSGREYDSIERVFAPVKDDIYFIAGNGGIISYQGEIIEKMAIPADILKEVVEYVRAQEGASFMTAGSAQAYVERADQAFVKKLREGYKLHVNEVDDVLNAPETMTKVAMYNEEVDAAVGAEEAKRRFGAVSYTHLDVYKRQVLIAENGDVYEEPAPKGKLINGVGAGDSMVAGFMACLLYTSNEKKIFISNPSCSFYGSKHDSNSNCCICRDRGSNRGDNR